MGAPHDAFVPAAILLENPGITLEEFDERLRSVGPFYKQHTSPFGRNSLIFNLNPYRTGVLPILRDILRVESDLRVIEPIKKDRWSIPSLEAVPTPGMQSWLSPTYNVNKYLGTRQGEIETREGADYGDYKEGKEICWGLEQKNYFCLNGTLQEDHKGMDRKNTFRIEEIISRTIKQIGAQQVPQAKLKLTRTIPVYQQETFETLGDLTKNYPKFSPARLFNLGQERGRLYVGHPFGIFLRWFKKSQGYYLDTKHLLEMEKLSHDKISPDSIYTSIILTAEAIKHKEWEMVSYASGDERDGILAQFLMAHPDSKIRHDNQLIQFWDSKNALDNGLTNSQWLANRGIEQWRRGLTCEQSKKEFELICGAAPAQIRSMNQRRKRDAESMNEIKFKKNSKEIPF